MLSLSSSTAINIAIEKRSKHACFSLYGLRLSSYFERWIKLSEVERSYEGLKELFLFEHIFSSVSDDLAVFLREKNLKTSTELLEAAECYQRAHPDKSMSCSHKGKIGMVGFTNSSACMHQGTGQHQSGHNCRSSQDQHTYDWPLPPVFQRKRKRRRRAGRKHKVKSKSKKPDKDSVSTTRVAEVSGPQVQARSDLTVDAGP